MIEYENECVDCGHPCMGNSCPNRSVPHYYCDCCGDEFDAGELYDYDGEAWCKHCIIDGLRKAYA